MAFTIQQYIEISGTLQCLTGLHIGGNKDDIEIGGMDNPVIRHPVTKQPYIPGSSLKGKIRSLLEYKYGKVTEDGKPCGCVQRDCPVCVLFGPHIQSRDKQNHGLGPTRLLFRDAALLPESIEYLAPMTEEGLEYAEIKTENIIDRKTGRAADRGLRSQERVPAGAKFEFHLMLRVFEGDHAAQMLDRVREGLLLLEQDYLGSSGSRGYGQVKIVELKLDGQAQANWHTESLHT